MFSFTEPTATHPIPSDAVTTETTPDVTTTPDTTTVVVPDTDSGTTVDTVGHGEGVVTDDAGREDTQGVVAQGEGAPEVTTEAPAEVSYYFGDNQVDIEVDPSHREAFSAKGLDIDALAAELYSKDGGFKLSDESYQKCCDAFGKFAIDAFLGGLKAQNDAVVSGWQSQAAEMERADSERYTSLASTIGGDEGWGRLEAFALETLTDEQLKGFNEVMASGNQYLQEFAIRELEGKRKGVQGDDSVDIIEGDASRGATEGGGPLSGADYIREIAALGQKYPNDKSGYAKAQEALTARRRAGMSAGL